MSTAGHTLSVICVSLNEQPNLPRLKTAIDQLIRPEGWALETILVDGGSRDGTVEAARQVGFDRVDALPAANIPACRNHGAGGAGGDILAYLDADCEPAPDWLTQAAPWLSGSEPTLVGWPAAPPDNSTWVQRAWHTHWSHKNPAWTELDGRRVVTRQAFRLLTTRNLLMNRQVFEALRGFDESLTTGEDTDFGRRADDQGVRVIAFPGLRVVHHGEPATLSAFFRQQLWHANRGSYRKIVHPGKGGNAWVFTALYLLTLVPAVLSLFGALALPAGWPLFGLLPFLALLLAPAIMIAARAGSLAQAPALALLYALYGLARSIDLLGFHRAKPSWKSPQRP